MPRASGEREKVKFGNREISVDAVERIFGAIRSGCQEIRSKGITITEMNALAKVGHDRATYSAKYLLQEGRVALTKHKVNGKGQLRHFYRIADAPKDKSDADPPEPEPDAVAKKKRKKKEPKPRVLSSAARIKLIERRHKALIKSKKGGEEKMDRRFGAQADAEEWSGDQ